MSPGQTGRTPGGVPPKFFMFIVFFFPNFSILQAELFTLIKNMECKRICTFFELPPKQFKSVSAILGACSTHTSKGAEKVRSITLHPASEL